MFILNSAAGFEGIAWATPISDALAMLVALALFIPYWKKLCNMMDENESTESEDKLSASVYR